MSVTTKNVTASGSATAVHSIDTTHGSTCSLIAQSAIFGRVTTESGTAKRVAAGSISAGSITAGSITAEDAGGNFSSLKFGLNNFFRLPILTS